MFVNWERYFLQVRSDMNWKGTSGVRAAMLAFTHVARDITMGG